MADYEVEPLFTQFGRTRFELSDDQKDQTAIEAFKGHMLDAFKLRNRATKLGYTRGAAQDGGWFLTYHKRFTTLQLEAVIDFTGNGLPEENRQVALINLHFSPLAQPGQETYGETSVPLGTVPAVLLRECYADLQAIAGEGTGFDPQPRTLQDLDHTCNIVHECSDSHNQAALFQMPQKVLPALAVFLGAFADAQHFTVAVGVVRRPYSPIFC